MGKPLEVQILSGARVKVEGIKGGEGSIHPDRSAGQRRERMEENYKIAGLEGYYAFVLANIKRQRPRRLERRECLANANLIQKRSTTKADENKSKKARPKN